MNAFEAARAATADIGLAVLATTFSLVVIFLPVSFMSSISGRFLYQFGITASVAILVSLLVSFTLTPMMSARLLEGHVAHGERPGDEAGSRRGFYHWLDERYARLLGWSMQHRQPRGAVRRPRSRSRRFLIFPFVRQEFIPGNVDEAEFEVSVNAPEGTSLSAMDEAMRAVESEIKQTRGVTTRAHLGGRRLRGRRQPGRRLRAHRSRTRSASSASDAIWHETRNLHAVARLLRQLQPARRDAGDPRPAPEVPAPAQLRAQHHLLQHRRRPHRDRDRAARPRHRDAGAARSRSCAS